MHGELTLELNDVAITTRFPRKQTKLRWPTVMPFLSNHSKFRKVPSPIEKPATLTDIFVDDLFLQTQRS